MHPTWVTHGLNIWGKCFPKENEGKANQRRAKGYWVLNFIINLVSFFDMYIIEMLPKLKTIQKGMLREA